ncbi:hypothetical protein B296_00018731 [Ensete ventricosum]|uniref:Uncharacterized protein n=1 Tax=Ensete ventricosum TaxID=4639 RepID=A0A426YHK5_ENSVE|nr:hypothetical protein B296_00018731 [Ensete ventricosum]
MSRLKERASRFGHSEEWRTLYVRGTTRTSKRRRMRSVQRLGWLSSSYGLTLATKLDVGTVLAKSRNLARAFAGAEQGTSCSARRSSLKGMVVSETSSGKNAKRKVALIGQISRRDKA